MHRSINDIARIAGTTSRTLRYYGEVGLLTPSRVGARGYRYYDEAALVRLQRILLLRELGLSIAAITEVFDGQQDDVVALNNHRQWLQSEKRRLDRQLNSIELTIRSIEGQREMTAEEMFDGFDNSAHQAEVTERWGAAAYEKSNSWWNAKSANDKNQWGTVAKVLIAEWVDAASRSVDPNSDEAHALAQRQYEWLAAIPGTPHIDGGPTAEYFVGLAEMYVADERFAATYGGAGSATFVRDAMKAYAERELG